MKTAIDHVISQLLDRDDGMLPEVIRLMTIDDRGTAEATLRRAIGDLPLPDEGELRQRMEAVIEQCQRLERDAAPRAREGLPNNIAEAQGEIQAASFLRELLEQELPPELISGEIDDQQRLYHERNFWRWKHGRREEEILELREELDPENPNYLAPRNL
jgi:hypothetical protein